jgi:multidrug transporter EmrE-like cation transporter
MSALQGATLTAVEAVGDFSFKAGNKPLGYVAYVGLATVLASLLEGGAKLSILNAYWDASSNILTYLVGWLWFGERLTTMQHVGFAMTLVGACLLQEPFKL